MKKHRYLLNSLLLILSISIGILVVEATLRFSKIEYPIFQTFDKDRGFALRPNASGRWNREGNAYVKINSRGLRDLEHKLTKGKNNFRIAILGDSFAEARSVNLEETFWFLMNERLNKCENHKYDKIETINFGVSEYGTAQQLLTLRKHVWKYDPDLILLAFFSGNDIADNSKILSKKKYRPYFVYNENEIILDNSFRHSKPYLLLKSNIGQLIIKMSNYSRILQVLREIYVNNYFAKKVTEKNIEPGLNYQQFYKPIDQTWSEAWEITESLIKLMNQDIKKKGKEFIVVTLSNPQQVHPDILHQETFKKDLNIDDLLYPDKRIKKLGDEENFLVINLAETLSKYANRNKVFLHGFENTPKGEGHWNEEGHFIASTVISKKICENFKSF